MVTYRRSRHLQWIWAGQKLKTHLRNSLSSLNGTIRQEFDWDLSAAQHAKYEYLWRVPPHNSYGSNMLSWIAVLGQRKSEVDTAYVCPYWIVQLEVDASFHICCWHPAKNSRAESRKWLPVEFIINFRYLTTLLDNFRLGYTSWSSLSLGTISFMQCWTSSFSSELR